MSAAEKNNAPIQIISSIGHGDNAEDANALAVDNFEVNMIMTPEVQAGNAPIVVGSGSNVMMLPDDTYKVHYWAMVRFNKQ